MRNGMQLQQQLRVGMDLPMQQGQLRLGEAHRSLHPVQVQVLWGGPDLLEHCGVFRLPSCCIEVRPPLQCCRSDSSQVLAAANSLRLLCIRRPVPRSAGSSKPHVGTLLLPCLSAWLLGSTCCVPKASGCG